MNPDKNIFRLTHVIQSIDKIEFITKDLSYGIYLEDWIKQDAIVRNIAIISEAISHAEDELKLKYPDVSWVQAEGMRNFLVQEYFKVDHDAVWATFHEELPNLKVQILSIIKDIS